MVKKVNKQEKKKVSFLAIVAVVLYFFAAGFIFLGVVKFRDYLSASPMGILTLGRGSTTIVISIMGYTFTFNGLTMAINYFVDAAVFFIWGSVLLILSRMFKKRKKKQTEEEYILEEEVVNDNDRFLPNEKVYCAYCDSELGVNDRKCPNCGAAKKIKK